MHCLICEWFSLFMDMNEWLTEWFSNNPVFLVSIICSCFMSLSPARQHELSNVQLPSINFVAHCETDNWNEKSQPLMIDWQITSFAQRQVNFPYCLQLINWECKVKLSMLVALGTNLCASQRALKANSWNDPMWEHCKHHLVFWKIIQKILAWTKYKRQWHVIVQQ